VRSRHAGPRQPTLASSGAIAARQRAARCAPADRWRWRWHVLVAAHEHVVLRLRNTLFQRPFRFFQPFLTLFPHTPTPLLYAHTKHTPPGGWGRGRRRRVGEARFATAGFAIAVSRPLLSRPLVILTWFRQVRLREVWSPSPSKSRPSTAPRPSKPMAQEPDEVALNSQKATLLDSAPLCAAVLDAQGKAKVVNKVFVELMGPLFKFSNYEFAEAASKDEGKASLKAAISAVFSGASPRERLRNIEMLTLAGESGLPVKTHFDWFIGPSKDPGEVTLYGDPCSDEILEQREKV
jgi:hypothetical protein